MAKEHLKYESTEIDRRLDLAGTALQEHQDISHLATKEEVASGLATKENVIEDLDEIRRGAELGATAIQEHQDISNLATKQEVTDGLAKKVDKVSGKQLSTEDFTTVLKTKLEGLNNYDDSDVRKLISQKQDTITDLKQIREGARLGSTALQEHQDISHLAEQSEVEKVEEDVTKHGQDIVALQTLTEEQGALVQESKSRLDVLGHDVTELKSEIETLTGIGEGSVVDIASKEVAKVIDSAPETMDALKKIADLIEKDAAQAADILVTLGNHENRISTLEDKFVVMSEADYDVLPNKEDKFYFCYDE